MDTNFYLPERFKLENMSPSGSSLDKALEFANEQKSPLFEKFIQRNPDQVTQYSGFTSEAYLLHSAEQTVFMGHFPKIESDKLLLGVSFGASNDLTRAVYGASNKIFCMGDVKNPCLYLSGSDDRQERFLGKLEGLAYHTRPMNSILRLEPKIN